MRTRLIVFVVFCSFLAVVAVVLMVSGLGGLIFGEPVSFGIVLVLGGLGFLFMLFFGLSAKLRDLRKNQKEDGK